MRRILYIVTHFVWITLWMFAMGLQGKISNTFDDVLWILAVLIAVLSSDGMIRSRLRRKRSKRKRL